METPKTILEIAVEVTELQRKLLEQYLTVLGFPYYIEPHRFNSLEEVEAQCEGK